MRAYLPLLLLLTACGGTDDPTGEGTPPDAPAFETCDGDCQTTRLSVAFSGQKRMLDRAFYGVLRDPGGTTLHIEAHRGGTTECPTETSPTPAYTLVLSGVPVPDTAAPVSAMGGSFLDFQGDVLGGTPVARMMQNTLTPVAVRVCTTCVGLPSPSDADGMVALDIEVTFSDGSLSGHLYATHCDSMDSFEP